MIGTQLQCLVCCLGIAFLLAPKSIPAEPAFFVQESANDVHFPPLLLERLTKPIRLSGAMVEGSASCAATACHGGPRAGVSNEYAIRGSEYPLWLERDPHANAYRTLNSQESLAMLERLQILKAGEIVDKQAFDNCLACHNTTTSQHPDFHIEGVGCASCHGPSQNWRDDHYRVRRDDLSNAQVGFVPNKNLVARARVCAACHVGDADRDMNHDLIAAGHPALHYEFATYHNLLPKHWREPQTEDLEAQLWLAGQVSALDASLALLEARAEKRLTVSQWPEFSALECSACHQSLRVGHEEYASPNPNAVAGLSIWNRFGVERLLALDKARERTPFDAELSKDLRRLTALVGERAIPDRAQTAESAGELRRSLDRWLDSPIANVRAFDAAQLRNVAVTALSCREQLDRWEFSSQSYLAAVAARQDWRGNEDALRAAEQLRRALLFKPNSNSLALLDEPQRNVSTVVDRLVERLNGAPRPTQTSDVKREPLMLPPPISN